MPTITGKSSSETLRGTDDADRIIPNGGEDIIYGGGGDDEINGYLVDPTDQRGGWSYYFQYESLIAYGGDGNDVIIGGSEADKLYGEDGDDVLIGYEGDDELFGGNGNDILRGREGNDVILGGDGDDYLDGGDGDDLLNGDLGDDEIRTGSGNDIARGGNGNDFINAGIDGFFGGLSGNKTIYGDAGNDKIGGGDGDDTIYGGAGNDYIWARDGKNSIYGEDGDDRLLGGDGDDIIEGGEGDDEIYGYGGNDNLIGGHGDDYLSGGDGDDLIEGGEGDDRIFASDGNDIIDGGKGDDVIYGGEGDDTLTGGGGQNVLDGYLGNDTYFINSLSDHIYDSGGNDTAIVSVSFAKIPIEIETVTYINGALPLPYWIDSLVASDGNGGRYDSYLGENREFYYTFPNELPDYDTREDHAEGYTGLNATQQRNAADLIKSLSSIIDVKILSTSSSDQQNTFAVALNNQIGSGGYAQYPNSRSTGSDIFLNNKDYNSTLSAGTYGAYVLTHELGHALGLKHPFDEADTDGDIADPPYLQGIEDHARWTMMSYNETSAEYKLAFSELDIAALQYIYGPSKTERIGDDTYYIDSEAPNFIWDGDGTDTIDASSLGERVTLHLNAGYHDFIGESASKLITAPGQITINFGSVIENLKGTSFSDDLYGNELDNEIQGNAGDDTIFGGKGDDKLDYSGAYGDDTLYGGPGDDEYYVYELSGNDKFIEYEDEGNDSVYTSISFSLDNSPHLENLYSFSDVESNIELKGNTLDNWLASSQGNCTIDGSSGSDTVWYGWNYSFEECYVFYRDGVLNVEKGNGSIDKLFNVEFLAFSDTTVAVNKNSFDNLDTNITISSIKSIYSEGESATFILSTEGVKQGTKVAYTISGISEEDIDGDALSGEFIIGEDGESIVTISLSLDEVTEGEESLLLILDEYEDKSITVKVIDTSVDPVFLTENYRTTILVDANVISEEPVLIHNLTEEISKKNGEVITHFFTYGESQYSYDDIDSSIMVILRNENFSDEFKGEIIDYAPTAAALNYSDLVKLVGLNTIDSTLIKIAGADSEYVS